MPLLLCSSACFLFLRWPRKVQSTGMASNVKPRLEALAVYLEQCENEGNFHDLRKQQFDLLLGSLETQLAALDFSDGAENAAILRSMSMFCVLTNAPRYISHDFQLALTHLFEPILWYLYLDRYSSKLLLYLYVSLCIFMYLYVSLCIFMYLYVSFETGSKDTKRYKKIHVSFGKKPKDTKRYKKIHVSFCIFLYLLNRFQKIHKDTLRYIQIHSDSDMLRCTKIHSNPSERIKMQHTQRNF